MKELCLREQLFAKQAKSDLASASAVWKTQLLKLEPFLMTKTEPRLVWLPKTHEEKTSAALSRRHEEVIFL